jgi:threonine aldolase
MNFASDNWAGAHPAVAASLTTHAAGHAPAYGASALDKAVEQRFCELFQRDVAVFFVATGTAANALALTAFARPGGVVFCHREAHMMEDECGAPEYFTGGARLCPVDGALGRIAPDALEAAIRRYPREFIHAGQPMAVSITQATEVGTLYTPEQIAALGAICRTYGLPLHMDGARFANALAALSLSPAELTWKCGVDAISFGGTKNGCWCAEAVVFFDPARATDFPFLRKRAAQLFSKSRFVAAQFDAYLREDLWLQMARHANAMADRLAGHVRRSQRARLAWEPETNEVFVIMARADAERLRVEGGQFYPWSLPYGYKRKLAEEEGLYRLVTSFATTLDEIDLFGAMLGRNGHVLASAS